MPRRKEPRIPDTVLDQLLAGGRNDLPLYVGGDPLRLLVVAVRELHDRGALHPAPELIPISPVRSSWLRHPARRIRMRR